MNKRQNKKNKNKKAGSAAKKNMSGKNTKNVLGVKPPDGAVESENSSGAEISLVPVCPDPEAGFQPLTHYLAKKLTKLTLHYMQKLCKKRGIKLDYQYWEAQIDNIISAPDPKEAIVIPARAGAGKSTAILALLLALVEILMTEKDMASSLVGAVLVVQKVETLNTIEAAIRKYFPDSPEKSMVALQAWSLSGQESGYCKNKNVTSYEDCIPAECPFAAGCKIQKFNSQALEAFLLGMTQTHFSLLRSCDELDRILFRDVDGEKLARRFIIFDEKFEMAETAVLGTDVINAASTEIERRGRKSEIPDRVLNGIQTGLSFNIQRPFKALRGKTLYETGKDQPFGFCSLSDPEDKDKFEEFHNRFSDKYKSFANRPLKQCMDVVAGLYDGKCLFSKSGSFHILYAKPPCVQFGESMTIIFDATAKVDGDYWFLPNVRFLDDLLLQCSKNIHFRVYEHPDMNVSRSALKKSWKLPTFAALIKQIVNEYPTKTFVCTYQDISNHLPELLGADVLKKLASMPNRENIQLPYFGGTNGANDFNDCYNVIMLGYPQLSPQDYLFKTYAAYRGQGLEKEITDLAESFRLSERVPKDILRQLHMLEDYENRHLAARLEQEIYRCAIRNPTCDEDINIFLFAPPRQLLQLLLPKFEGCNVNYIKDLPECVEEFKNENKSYAGEETAFNKFKKFIESWDGNPVTPTEVQEKLNISKSAWKEIRKKDNFKALLKKRNVIETGRGVNAKLEKKSVDDKA